jgi:hypothetical protein
MYAFCKRTCFFENQVEWVIFKKYKMKNVNGYEKHNGIDYYIETENKQWKPVTDKVFEKHFETSKDKRNRIIKTIKNE